jgi:hypothetical protein
MVRKKRISTGGFESQVGIIVGFGPRCSTTDAKSGGFEERKLQKSSAVRSRQ